MVISEIHSGFVFSCHCWIDRFQQPSPFGLLTIYLISSSRGSDVLYIKEHEELILYSFKLSRCFKQGLGSRKLSKREVLVLVSPCHSLFKNRSKLQRNFYCGIVFSPPAFLIGLKPLVKAAAWIFSTWAEVVTAQTIALGGRRWKHRGAGQKICYCSLRVQIGSQFLHCSGIVAFVWIKLANVSVQLPLASARFLWSEVLCWKPTSQWLNSCETWGTASRATAVTLYYFGVCPLTCFLRSLSQIAIQNCKYLWDPIKGKPAFCAVEFSVMLALDFSAVCPWLVTSFLSYATLQRRSAPELFAEGLLPCGMGQARYACDSITLFVFLCVWHS